MKNILILCTGNSCRSQIAHGFLNHFTDNSFSIYSAGIEKHGLNKNAVKSMADIGIDISHHNSNLIDEYKDEYDLFVELTDNEFVPSFMILNQPPESPDPKLFAPERDFEEIDDGVEIIKKELGK